MNSVTSIREQSDLCGDAAQLAPELLTMQGVNYELMPVVRMTAPENWVQVPIPEWPVDDELFTSVIMLFGFIPLDLHRFGLRAVSWNGFSESSSSLVMKAWRHDRVIESLGTLVRVTDSVEFSPRLSFLGPILSPLYRQVFKHRHQRLRRKYPLAA